MRYGAIAALLLELEDNYEVEVSRPPSVCFAMVPAEDSLEKQKFFLGEALVQSARCWSKKPGYGLCLGDEPVRTYCMAVIDAFVHGGLLYRRKSRCFCNSSKMCWRAGSKRNSI